VLPFAPAFGRDLSDREFLAPALEILETPPSPVHLAFLWIICALVVASLAWAYFGRIDIIAIALGKFQPTGRVKVIEPLETGRVAAIWATNGSLVAEGDILVELDRSASEADLAAAKDALASARAETLRRQAALAAASARVLSLPPGIDWPADIAPSRREREDRVLAADLGQLEATLASFAAERKQKSAERDMLLETIATQKKLVATLKERVDMRTRLVEVQAGAKAAVIDATETLQHQQTQLAAREQELAALTAGLEVIDRDSEKAVETFLSDDAQKLSEAERRVEEARERLAKAEAVIDHLTLRRSRAVVDHRQCRPGRRQRPGGHARRAAGFEARD
jgi:hemolysin D